MSYTAKDSFWFGNRIIHRGDVLAEDDSVVEGREHLFDHKDEKKAEAPKPHRGRPAHKHEDEKHEE